MNPLLLSALTAAAAVVLALAQPEARSIAALKAGALAAVLTVVGAWLWPMHAATIGIGLLAAALLWLLGQALTWPLRYIAGALRGD
jgi:hypothetical protein